MAIKWLERVERDAARESLSDTAAIGLQADAAPGLSGGRAGREIGRHASGAVRSPGAERGVKADTSMMSRFFRRIGVTGDPCRGEQDRPDISRHRKRWRTYQAYIDPRRLVFIDET